MLKGIKACFFDAYGTLFDVHAPVARIAEDLGENASPISDLWRMKQLQYTWLRSLMQAHTDFWQVTGEALDYALAAYGIERPEIHERLMNLYLTLDAYPDAVQALTDLKKAGLTTGILSNGSKKMLQAAVNSAGLAPVLDHVLSVDDVGIYKPDPKVYRMVSEKTNLSPGEVCFVSANAWDASAGAYFGFQVVHINRFNQPQERMPGEPKAVINSLGELPSLIN